MPRQTVQEIAKRLTPEEREAAKEGFIAKAVVVRDAAMDRLYGDILNADKRLSGMELNAVVGTLTDKVQILTGGATEHIAHRHLHEIQTREALARRLLSLPGFVDLLPLDATPPALKPGDVLPGTLPVPPQEKPHAPEN